MCVAAVWLTASLSSKSLRPDIVPERAPIGNRLNSAPYILLSLPEKGNSSSICWNNAL